MATPEIAAIWRHDLENFFIVFSFGLFKALRKKWGSLSSFYRLGAHGDVQKVTGRPIQSGSCRGTRMQTRQNRAASRRSGLERATSSDPAKCCNSDCPGE
jgi:hypothetical protein